MPPKQNPLRLNKLQLRTLSLAQVLTRDPNTGKLDEATGDVELLRIPQTHGDHVHVGQCVVSAQKSQRVFQPDRLDRPKAQGPGPRRQSADNDAHRRRCRLRHRVRRSLSNEK